ncbi:hypothetical protein H6G33_13720 [Calothrix sp. FACHB-1219]|uniref:hypothetical protein n=1 Tax=unclassified Calothrix TaxID=2619626 RepID=UPI0016848F76|nr:MULTISPECIES: hypothetical protein [unclassified Calothrix]MBD2204758.1 hypothetical protein [Calothrix sp. FACHB-168]MBD2218094.1 hypothetical protein [Calothrix sp. FACHB-1219]
MKNRTFICSLVAIASGIIGAYISGQTTLMLHSQKCQNQTWGMQQLCNTWVTPGAIWQGSTTGLWMGTILGAFVAGMATSQNRN